MLDAVAIEEVLSRMLSIRDGKNPYPENKRQFWWALETADREAIGDAYVDLFDPRPLNRQVLEASGFELVGEHLINNGLEVEFYNENLWAVPLACHDEGEIKLRTIGDFRRFCSLPGIEIEVVVPEDYKPC